MPGEATLFLGGRDSYTGLFRQCLDQLAAEIGDICHYAAPDQIPVAKCRFILPGTTSIYNIIFDTERASGRSPHDSRRDGDQAAMTDDADDLPLGIHFSDQLLHNGMPSQLIRRPASRYDQSEEVICIQIGNLGIGSDLQPIFT